MGKYKIKYEKRFDGLFTPADSSKQYKRSYPLVRHKERC